MNLTPSYDTKTESGTLRADRDNELFGTVRPKRAYSQLLLISRKSAFDRKPISRDTRARIIITGTVPNPSDHIKARG